MRILLAALLTFLLGSAVEAMPSKGPPSNRRGMRGAVKLLRHYGLDRRLRDGVEQQTMTVSFGGRATVEAAEHRRVVTRERVDGGESSTTLLLVGKQLVPNSTTVVNSAGHMTTWVYWGRRVGSRYFAKRIELTPGRYHLDFSSGTEGKPHTIGQAQVDEGKGTYIVWTDHATPREETLPNGLSKIELYRVLQDKIHALHQQTSWSQLGGL